MSIEEQIEYHSQRAIGELDRGLVAASVPAARAHLQLSSLHLTRMRELRGSSKRQDPPAKMG